MSGAGEQMIGSVVADHAAHVKDLIHNTLLDFN